MKIREFFYANPDQYPPIINSVRLLAEAQHQISIFCRKYEQEWGVLYPKQVDLVRINIPKSQSWKEYSHFVYEVIRQADKDTSIYIGNDMHGLLPARLLATRYRKPLVYHCHDFAMNMPSLAFGGRLVKIFEQQFARTADLVIVPDFARAQIIRHKLDLRNDPVIVANAPLHANNTAGIALSQALAEHGYYFEKILFRQGRIGYGHTLENTLRSMPNWQSSEWGFVIMGISEPEYRRSLLALADHLGVSRQFVILPPVSYDQVHDFTPGADVGHALYQPIHVNNQHITTASNKIMEYMASGIPLLVSTQSDLQRFVEKYHCGISADENSPESIANAVNVLLGNPDLAKRMGLCAVKAFENEFSYAKQFAPVLARLDMLSQSARSKAIQ